MERVSIGLESIASELSLYFKLRLCISIVSSNAISYVQ